MSDNNDDYQSSDDGREDKKKIVDLQDKRLARRVKKNLWVDRLDAAEIMLGEKYFAARLRGYHGGLIAIKEKATGRLVPAKADLYNFITYKFREKTRRKNPIFKDMEHYAITPGQAKDLVDTWLVHQTYENEITHFIGPYDPLTTIHSFNLDLREGDYPHWAEIMSRTHNYKAISAWIYSLLVETSPRSQYVWLEGFGGDSKSVISDFLIRYLGDAAIAINGLKSMGRFFVGENWSKRLVVVHESDGQICGSDDLKSLVTDKRQTYERKFEPTFSCPVNFMFLFCSNNPPVVKNIAADRRRIIYGKMSPFDKEKIPHERLMQILADEFPYYLNFCREVYEDLNDGSRILTCDESLNETISINENEYQWILETYFSCVDYKNYPTRKVKKYVDEEIKYLEIKSNARLRSKDVTRVIRDAYNEKNKRIDFDIRGFLQYLFATAKSKDCNFNLRTIRGINHFNGLIAKSDSYKACHKKHLITLFKNKGVDGVEEVD